MGKSRLLEAVQQQATWLTEVLIKQAGRAGPVNYALRVAIVNVIWQLVGGELMVCFLIILLKGNVAYKVFLFLLLFSQNLHHVDLDKKKIENR